MRPEDRARDTYNARDKLPAPWRNPTPRPKDRIPLVLARIGTIWTRWPDLRLGQLLVNATGREHLFYVEDDELLAALDRFLETEQ